MKLSNLRGVQNLERDLNHNRKLLEGYDQIFVRLINEDNQSYADTHTEDYEDTIQNLVRATLREAAQRRIDEIITALKELDVEV